MIDIVLVLILIGFSFGFMLGGMFMVIVTSSRYEDKIQKLWERWLEDEKAGK